LTVSIVDTLIPPNSTPFTYSNNSLRLTSLYLLWKISWLFSKEYAEHIADVDIEIVHCSCYKDLGSDW